jgi:hypothetical protein
MTRLLACGEALIGLATAAASLPGLSSESYLSNTWLVAGFLGLLPPAYSLAVGILARVTNEAPLFASEEETASLQP